ncbi:MAG: S-layer homology domain-containing protein [Ruminococcaceae bacterium]|nr:S-layer homology domain-containing protein [Oscillospiraceae bacterium]
MIKRIVSLCLASLMLFSSVYAVSIDTQKTDYDFDTKICHIEGVTTYKNQPVKLEVLKKNKSFDNSITFDDVIYINQINSDENKKFSFDVYEDEAGIFSYRITELGSDEVKISGFVTYTDETVDDAIKAYYENEARTTSDLKKLIDDYYPKFNIDYTKYKELEQNLGEYLGKINSATYTDAQSFKDDVALEIALGIINLETDTSKKLGYIDEYKIILGLDEDEIYDEFSKLGLNEDGTGEVDSVAKEKIISNIRNDLTKENIASQIKNYYVLYKIEGAVWSDIKGIVNTYLDLDLTDTLKNITNAQVKDTMSYIKKQVEDKVITNTDDILSYVVSYVQSLPVYTPSKGGGGGGSSKGGYVVSGGNVTIPSTNNEQIVSDSIPYINTNTSYFNDLDNVLWAKDAIENLYAAKIVNGVGDKTFNPNGNVKREEYIKMLVSMLKLEDSNAQSSFEDVDKNAWYII